MKALPPPGSLAEPAAAPLVTAAVAVPGAMPALEAAKLSIIRPAVRAASCGAFTETADAAGAAAASGECLVDAAAGDDNVDDDDDSAAPAAAAPAT